MVDGVITVTQNAVIFPETDEDMQQKAKADFRKWYGPNLLFGQVNLLKLMKLEETAGMDQKDKITPVLPEGVDRMAPCQQS